MSRPVITRVNESVPFNDNLLSRVLAIVSAFVRPSVFLSACLSVLEHSIAIFYHLAGIPVWLQSFSFSRDIGLSKEHSGFNSPQVVQKFCLANGLSVWSSLTCVRQQLLVADDF